MCGRGLRWLRHAKRRHDDDPERPEGITITAAGRRKKGRPKESMRL